MKISMKISTLAWFLGATLAEVPVTVGYYTSWGKLEVKDIPFDKVTHINFAFGILKNRTSPAQIDLENKGRLTELVGRAAQVKGEKPKILLAIGGWTGSQTFSWVAKNKCLRKTLIDNLLKLIQEYKLDGIDIDWEFPGGKGPACNEKDPKDSDNYLVLLKELKERIGGKLLTAAVRITPFDGQDGNPMSDVSEYANYFDFINVMAYDISGTWNANTGPNAPLNHHKDKGDPFSFAQSLAAWEKAGFPKNKLVGGLAFYGRTMETKQAVTKHSQFVEQTKANIPGDSNDEKTKSTVCIEEGDAQYSGLYSYKSLREEILKESPTVATQGYQRFFDNVTMTPYIYQKEKNKFITYDDPISIKAKADYISKNKYRGVMIWELSNDYQNELINAAQLS